METSLNSKYDSLFLPYPGHFMYQLPKDMHSIVLMKECTVVLCVPCSFFFLYIDITFCNEVVNYSCRSRRSRTNESNTADREKSSIVMLAVFLVMCILPDQGESPTKGTFSSMKSLLPANPASPISLLSVIFWAIKMVTTKKPQQDAFTKHVDCKGLINGQFRRWYDKC